MMKKIAKQSEKEILYGTWMSYTRSSFNGKSLEQMIRSLGLTAVQEYVDRKIKPRLQKGEEILNTNFEQLGLRK
jgi:hypothetical protein